MTTADTGIRRVTTLAGDPAWLITRYDDVKALLADQRLGRSHPDPAHAPRVSGSAIFGGPTGDDPVAEDADRVRMRRLLAPVFCARRMAALRPRIETIVDELLDAMFDRTPLVDLHEAVSFPLPALVVSELLGVPYADRDDFRHWSDDAANLVDTDRAQLGLFSLGQYMRGLVEAKRAQPADDVLRRGGNARCRAAVRRPRDHRDRDRRRCAPAAHQPRPARRPGRRPRPARPRGGLCG